jgi:hypothetical protein
MARETLLCKFLFIFLIRAAKVSRRQKIGSYKSLLIFQLRRFVKPIKLVLGLAPLLI